MLHSFSNERQVKACFCVLLYESRCILGKVRSVKGLPLGCGVPHMRIRHQSRPSPFRFPAFLLCVCTLQLPRAPHRRQTRSSVWCHHQQSQHGAQSVLSEQLSLDSVLVNLLSPRRARVTSSRPKCSFRLVVKLDSAMLMRKLIASTREVLAVEKSNSSASLPVHTLLRHSKWLHN